jgi:hypothetical protein
MDLGRFTHLPKEQQPLLQNKVSRWCEESKEDQYHVSGSIRCFGILILEISLGVNVNSFEKGENGIISSVTLVEGDSGTKYRLSDSLSARIQKKSTSECHVRSNEYAEAVLFCLKFPNSKNYDDFKKISEEIYENVIYRYAS